MDKSVITFKSNDGSTIKLSDHLVIGADGARSKVRESFPKINYSQ